MKTEIRNGEIIFYGDTITLKFDTKRKLYIKKNEDKIFKLTDYVLPEKGLKKYEKEKCLLEIHNRIIDNLDEQKSDEQDEELLEDDENN